MPKHLTLRGCQPCTDSGSEMPPLAGGVGSPLQAKQTPERPWPQCWGGDAPQHPGESPQVLPGKSWEPEGGSRAAICRGEKRRAACPSQKTNSTLPALCSPFSLEAVLGSCWGCRASLWMDEPLRLLLGKAGSARPSSPPLPPPPPVPSRGAASPSPALQIQLVTAGLIDCRFPRN